MISVITAVHSNHVEHLPRAGSSLTGQLPPGQLEWLIQLDGPKWSLPKLPCDLDVQVTANGRALGVSVTRNRALAVSRGGFVFALDADDELLPGALATLSNALLSDPAAAYAIGESLDLLPDGRRLRRFSRRMPNARIDPGGLEELWRRDKVLPLQPGAVLFRREHLLAVGGWPAMAGMEDQDLLLAVAAGQPGIYCPEPVYLYHQHRGQTVRTAEFNQELRLNRSWTDARLRARRRVEGGDPDVLPEGVPIPSADEITQALTSEWQQQAQAQLPDDAASFIELRVHSPAGLRRSLSGARLEIALRDQQVDQAEVLHHSRFGALWTDGDPEDLIEAAGPALLGWELETGDTGHNGFGQVLVDLLTDVLPSDAVEELIQLGAGVDTDFTPWHVRTSREVPAALQALGCQWLDLLVPSVNWRGDDVEADPAVHYRRVRAVWSESWLISLWSATSGAGSSPHRTWGLPTREVIAVDSSVESEVGVRGLHRLVEEVVGHLDWAIESTDIELESWQNDFLRRSAIGDVWLDGADLGRLRRHLSEFGVAIGRNREAVRTLARRARMSTFPEPTRQLIDSKCVEMLDSCARQRDMVITGFELVSSAVASNDARLAEEQALETHARSDRDRQFQQTISVFAALFLAPGLVFAFYGTNVDLPLDRSGASFAFVLCMACALLFLTLLVINRLRR